MANGLAAFVAGMGTGYLRAEDKKLERERQDKLDKITFDRADRERRDDIEQQDLKQALATAAAQPQMVDTAQAPTDGMGPVRSADAPNRYQVGATGFADPVAAQAAVTAGQKTPDQVNAAMSGILRSRGLYERANALDADIGRQKLNQIQLKEAELAHLDRETNRQFDEILSKAGNWQDGISQVLTKTNVGGLEGTQVKPFLSRDRKTVEFKAYLPDGTEKSLGQFSNDEQGQIRARQQIMKADPLTKIQWLKEQATEEHKLKREAVADSQWQQTFDLNAAHQKVMEGLQKGQLSISQAHLNIAKGAEKRAQALHDETMRLPEPVKQSLAATSKQIEIQERAMADAMAKGVWDATKDSSKEFTKRLNSLHADYQNTIAPYMKNVPTGDVAERGSAAPKASAGVNAQPAAAPVATAVPSATAGVVQPAAATATQLASTGGVSGAAKTPLQEAYDKWQAIKSENRYWYGAKKVRPGSEEAEAAAEAEYSRLLRTQYK